MSENETKFLDFKVGDRVAKRSGDYYFDGVIIGIVRKRDNRTIRFIVEDDNGLALVLNDKQLEPYNG